MVVIDWLISLVYDFDMIYPNKYGLFLFNQFYLLLNLLYLLNLFDYFYLFIYIYFYLFSYIDIDNRFYYLF